MLAHSFHRFCVVTKFMLPTIGDLKFSKLNFDYTHAYMRQEYAPNTELSRYMLELKAYCNKIRPFVTYYKKLINSYNNSIHNILEKEIKLLLPQVNRSKNMELSPHWYQVLWEWLTKVYLVSFTINEIMPYTKLLML